MNAVADEDDIKYIDGGQFLLESGLLFEINRRILHPLGIAMQVERPKDSSTYIISNNLWDYRSDECGITYDAYTLKAGEEKLWRFMEEFGVGKMQERQRNLGYVLQKSDIIRQSESI